MIFSTAQSPHGDYRDATTEMSKRGKRLKHESCNLLHRYFEELQGTAWQLSPYYKQADPETKYAIRQLNNICHEIESWVKHTEKKIEPDWIDHHR
jgi:hypothetical protein